MTARSVKREIRARRAHANRTDNRKPVEPEPVRCSAGNYADTCCLPGSWDRITLGGLYGQGEPLPPAVADVAAERGIDPHTLDSHVEGKHGWEPHNAGYAEAVRAAADCVVRGNCGTEP